MVEHGIMNYLGSTKMGEVASGFEERLLWTGAWPVGRKGKTLAEQDLNSRRKTGKRCDTVITKSSAYLDCTL